MKIIKAILLFLFLLGLYSLPALIFKSDVAFYNSLKKPIYAPPAILFGVIWPILYVIFSLYLTIKIINQQITKEMVLYFLINYGISFFFNKVFFIDKKLFLSFVVTFCSFLSGLFIFITTFKTSKKDFLFILPYLIWTGFASILMTHIYLIN